MPRRPKILFLANWPSTTRDPEHYAFFAHWESRPRVRFFGTQALGAWSRWERDVFKFYLVQPLLALFLAPFYDAVVAFSSQSGLPFALLLRLCFWMRVKLIVFDVESFGRVRGGWPLRLARFAASRIDRVVYASRGQEAYYDRWFPQGKDRRVFIPLGVGDYEKRRPDDAGREGPIVALGKHGAAFRDWACLLHAYADHAAQAELWIVGRRDLPPEERAGAAIPPSVRFVPYLPMDELRDVIEQARFVVLPLPEREQSLGQLSALLTMALGKAVIASGVIGLRDYVRDGETGLCYPAGDARALSACLGKLLAAPDLAAAYGRAARQRQQAEFNDRLMAQRWEELFRAVTGGAR